MQIPYEKVASFYKALADRNRLIIIFKLAGGQRSVSQIINETKLSQPLVSHHLKELKNGLIVKTKRRGPFVFYELNEPDLIDLIKLTNQFLFELRKRNNETFLEDNEFKMTFKGAMKEIMKDR